MSDLEPLPPIRRRTRNVLALALLLIGIAGVAFIGLVGNGLLAPHVNGVVTQPCNGPCGVPITPINGVVRVPCNGPCGPPINGVLPAFSPPPSTPITTATPTSVPPFPGVIAVPSGG